MNLLGCWDHLLQCYLTWNCYQCKSGSFLLWRQSRGKPSPSGKQGLHQNTLWLDSDTTAIYGLLRTERAERLRGLVALVLHFLFHVNAAIQRMLILATWLSLYCRPTTNPGWTPRLQSRFGGSLQSRDCWFRWHGKVKIVMPSWWSEGGGREWEQVRPSVSAHSLRINPLDCLDHLKQSCVLQSKMTACQAGDFIFAHLQRLIFATVWCSW